MKFALVTETFPPEVNGVSMTLGRLCHGLARLGWNVQVVRPVQEAEEQDIVGPEQPFEEFLVAGVPLPGYSALRFGEPAGFSLHRNWKRDRPDVVHVATEGPLGVAALSAARLLGIPVTSTFHTNFDQYSDHYRIGWVQELATAYLRGVHNFCELTLAPTRQMADALASVGYQNTGVMSRGVDTQLFNPSKRDEALRGEWGVEDGGKVSLYVGRVAKEKNIDLAFEAFAEIRKRFPKDRMVVVGDGPEMVRLRRKYPDVCYAGMRRGEELARYYASGDLFLFPSVTETFGNVVTEAMASGLAVCTYDYAAGREYIEDCVNGTLAAFGDEKDFVRQAVRLRECDEDSHAAMRAKARTVAEGISWEAVIQGFQASLQEVVAKYRR